MNTGQWRVLGLLLALGAIELAFSPSTRAYAAGFGKAVTGGSQASVGDIITGMRQTDMSLVLLWVISAVVLLAIADVAPSVATWIAFLLLVSVVLLRGGSIASWINATTDYLKNRSEKYPGVRGGGNK